MTSAPNLKLCPPADEREIAFAGRSNAGKSSVLNRLTGSRQTAKVSKTPGRTQLLNFFGVRGGGRVVDLPGYGYAKADRAAQARWQAAVNEYLTGRPNLVGLVLVMDIRHPLQPLDLDLIDWGASTGMPLLILLNKADKLKFGAQQKVLQQVQAALRAKGIGAPAATVITFSALRGLNVNTVVRLLGQWLAGEGADPEPALDQ
jgi:GTP-binding protein